MMHHYGVVCYDIEETKKLYEKVLGGRSFLTIRSDTMRKTFQYIVTHDLNLIELNQDWDYDGEPFTAYLDHVGYEVDGTLDHYIYIPEIGVEMQHIFEEPISTELLVFEEGCNPWECIDLDL